MASDNPRPGARDAGPRGKFRTGEYGSPLPQRRKRANTPAVPPRPPTPSGIYPFRDVFRVERRRPFTHEEIKFLRRHSRHVKIACFAPEFVREDRRRLRLFQARRKAVDWLTAQADVRPTETEEALDLTYPDAQQRDEMDDFFRCYHVKRYHRRRHEVKIVKGTTRYTDPRHAATGVAAYSHRSSKVTGEMYNVHPEVRITGGRALARQKISSMTKLRQINAREFWQRHLTFYALHLRKFGRAYLKLFGDEFAATRHAPEVIGYRIWHTNGYSVQQVIDKFGDRIRMHRCLIPLDASNLLPPHRTPYYDIYLPFCHSGEHRSARNSRGAPCRKPNANPRK